jgi:OCT family organic cation transporter-like MFS transporter 4/5
LIGGDFGKALPLAIFGITSVIAGLLCLFLPETLNQKLPDTVEDAAKFKG